MQRDLAGTLRTAARRRGDRGFTFDDLARAARGHRASIGELAAWLADGRSSGAVVDVGFDPGVLGDALGPRRYRLAEPDQMKQAS